MENQLLFPITAYFPETENAEYWKMVLGEPVSSEKNGDEAGGSGVSG